jgi:hypothetical protein
MPSRGGGKHCEIAKIEDRKLAKDLESYERMRKQGLRPKATSGASEVESKCESAFEVERGMSAADMARLSPSAQRDEAGARRDIAKGAPEYRRRALEAKAELDKGDLGFHNDGTGRKQGVGV